MSIETKQTIASKNKCRKEKCDKSSEYKMAKAESKKLVKRDRINQVEKDLDAIANLPPHKQYYAAIKRLKSKPKDISWGIKDKSGEILNDKDSILERCEEFYEDLYHDLSPDIDINDSEEEEIPPIIQSEVRKAIEDLKIGKSPGLDNIYSEYIKAGGEPLMDASIHPFLQIQIQVKFHKSLQMR